MCLTPRMLPDGTEVGCRKCWQCKADYINDWVGRCIAEGETAKAVNVVTLTYRETGLRSSLLTYSDVQAYFKALRRDGFPVRYVVAGEHGSKKGRAHWHAVLFWQDRQPWYALRQNFPQEHWDHGFSYWDEASVKSLQYVCKYLRKPTKDGEAQSLFRMSKFPPLGSAYFRKLALQYVKQGLAPQDACYTFPGILDERGRPRRFRLQRQSRNLFVASFLVQWSLYRGGHPPVSPFLEEWCDQNAGSALAAAKGVLLH